MSKSEILTIQQTIESENRYIQKFSFKKLINLAGRRIADYLEREEKSKTILFICGPGNNGKDGEIAFSCLEYRLKVFIYKIDENTKDKNLKKLQTLISNSELILDCIFGTGLNRKISGRFKAIIDFINNSKKEIISIDIPTGINGDTGQKKSCCIKADSTLVMGFYKPGHFLLPGKMYVGKLKKLNIGLTSSSKKCPDINLIEKSFFKKEIPKHKININKYDKGHVIVLGGKMPGASRLVAFSSRKTGAGLSTIIVDKENLKFYLKTEPGTIIEIIKQESLKKKNVLIIGPGLGKDYSRKRVIEVINSFFGPIIVDADAISIFKDHKEVFYNLIRKKKNIILTPHINEFKRLFDYNDKSKMISCLKAAEKISNCVLLKGNDTIIAFPSGKIWINNLPNNSLATAGSGDVLCGIISGFLSQKMNYEHAIVAAVWVQSQVAKPKKNVVVEDFLKDIPLVIDSLKKK